MSASLLLLTEEQVPLGAEVLVCPPGSTEPLDGPPLTRLMGGVPIRPKFYELGSAQTKETVGIDGRNIKVRTMHGGMEGFLDGVRFLPTKVFSANDAPVEIEFAVFSDNKPMLYADLPEVVQWVGKFTADLQIEVMVRKEPSGEWISTVGGFHLTGNRPLLLPDDVQLIPLERKAPS